MKTAVIIALAFSLATSGAAADEAVWPQHSAGDVSVLATMLRFGIHADHCSAQLPQLKPQFDGLMQNLDGRIQGIAKRLLSSAEFKGMKDMPVPATVLDALKDSFHDGEHTLERQDAAAICPQKLQRFSEVDDESLEYSLAANLKAVRNMIQNLQKEDAR
jgi:hypothetical protein